MREWLNNLWDTFKHSHHICTRERAKDVMSPQNPFGVAGWSVPEEKIHRYIKAFLECSIFPLIAWQRKNPVRERRRKCKSLKSDLRTVKSPSWSISPSGSVWLSQSGPHPPLGSKSKAFDLPTMKIRRKHGRANLMEGVILKLLCWLTQWTLTLLRLS